MTGIHSILHEQTIPSPHKFLWQQVLGDRSIKYKYLNPNTLLVALGSGPGSAKPPPASAPSAAKGTAAAQKSLFSDDDDDIPSVTLLLLDSATGRVLHSQVQLGASGPVRLVFTENTAVVELWDNVAKRWGVLQE